MVDNYTCKRQTQRWPMVLWYNMIDVATLNGYSFFRAQHPEFSTGITNARWHFLTELSKEFVTPHMKSRLEGNPNLPTCITEAMGRCGVTKAANQQQERSTEGQQKRKRCQMCPRNKDRKSTNCCWKCSTPPCNGHRQKKIVCDNCTQWIKKISLCGHMSGQCSGLMYVHSLFLSSRQMDILTIIFEDLLCNFLWKNFKKLWISMLNAKSFFCWPKYNKYKHL